MVNVIYADMNKEDFDKDQFWEDFNSYIGSGIYPLGMKNVLDFDVFDEKELKKLYRKLETGFVGRLDARHPKDAFEYLGSMCLVAEKMPHDTYDAGERLSSRACVEDLDSDGFLDSVSAIDAGVKIDAMDCRNYFERYLDGGQGTKLGARYKSSLSRMLTFIRQNLTVNHQEETEGVSQAVEMAKVVAYLVKAKRGIQYFCSDERRVIARFSPKCHTNWRLSIPVNHTPNPDNMYFLLPGVGRV